MTGGRCGFARQNGPFYPSAVWGIEPIFRPQGVGMQFEAFWHATGEQPFDLLVASAVECYRLTVRSSRGAGDRVIRLQRSSPEAAEDVELVAHFIQFGQNKKVSSWTHRIRLEARHLSGLTSLLAVAGFWELPERINRCGFDGETYTLEAFCGGRQHRIERWSPDPVASGGELTCVVTDYLERLGFLALYRSELHLRYG